jgi:hypothetical protein
MQTLKNMFPSASTAYNMFGDDMLFFYNILKYSRIRRRVSG